MTHKITCDNAGCDTWARTAGPMITVSQDGHSDEHLCSMKCLMEWAARRLEVNP